MQFNYKKRFGQHFLTYVPPAIFLEKKDLEEIKSMCVIEIGPGIGALTKAVGEKLIKEKVPHIDYHCIDIDPEALMQLKEETADLQKEERITMHYHHGDILNIDLSKLVDHCDGIWIIGSLPYNISKQIVNWAFEELSKLENREQMMSLPIRFIIQKEVAENYLSRPPKADFLSHLMYLFANSCRLLKVLPPGSFTPAPKVTSALIEMQPKLLSENEYKVVNKIARFIRECYLYKRKKLKQILQKKYGKKITDLPKDLAEITEKRPEELDSADYIALYYFLNE